MKVAVIRNEMVEWRTAARSETVHYARWHGTNFLSCLEEDSAEAVLLIGVTDGLKLACSVRRSEAHRKLPVAILSHDPNASLHDLGQYLSSFCDGPVEVNASPRRLHVDRRARETWVDKTYESCSPMEFRLLLFFLQYPRIVFCREELVKRVRLEEGPVDARIIDVLVLRLRRKIERFPESPKNLRTVPNLGYVFEYNGDSVIDVETNAPFQSWAYPPVVTFCSSQVY